jgi:pimeloyl-ACP methyl ester carboxylesterase
VEAVLGVGVADDVGVHRRVGERLAQRLDVLDGDGRVEVAEQPEPRRLQRGRPVDERRELREPAAHDPAAVEPDRGPERPLERDEERHAAAHAEPDDADALVREPRGVEVADRGVDVDEQRVVAQPLEQREHLREVAVGRDAAAGPMEDVRRHGPEPAVGEPARDVLDVVVHTERLLDHDDRGAVGRVGLGVVDVHRAVGGRQRDRARRHGADHTLRGVPWSRVDGAGDVTVVLTHGWGATAHMWQPQVDALAPHASVVTGDLRGHGRSESPDDAAAYTQEVALADLDALVGERAVLVGHSLGGQLSLAFAIRHPDRVLGLGLLSTGPGYRDAAGRDAWNDTIERQARALEKRGLEALPAGEDMHGGLHTSASALAHAIRGFVKQHDSSIMDGAPAIAAPTLVLVGAKDRGFLAAADWFERKLPHAWKVVVPDAGHGVNRHQPDAVNAALEELLQRSA